MIWAGFIAANFLGLGLFVAGLTWTWASMAFTGKYRYSWFLLLSVAGSYIIYWAWTHGPIAIAIVSR